MSVNDSDKDIGVVRATSVGASVSDTPGTKFSLGYSSVKAVTVAPSQDALIEVEHSPLGDIAIEVQPVTTTP